MVWMKVFYKGKNFAVNAKKLGFFGKLRGLMFRGRDADSLLFEFDKEKEITIHSFFCKPFIAAWLDDKHRVNKVLLVNKWLPLISGKGKYLIEIPLNRGNRKIIDFLVGKRKV